jgi:hypothetical protein
MEGNMHSRTQEFRDITDRLGLSTTETASLIGRSRSTVLQYRSGGVTSRVPTETVMTKLRGHWKSQLRARLECAVADLRDAGLVVEIGWGPIMERAAVDAAVDEQLAA